MHLRALQRRLRPHRRAALLTACTRPHQHEKSCTTSVSNLNAFTFVGTLRFRLNKHPSKHAEIVVGQGGKTNCRHPDLREVHVLGKDIQGTSE